MVILHQLREIERSARLLFVSTRARPDVRLQVDQHREMVVAFRATVRVVREGAAGGRPIRAGIVEELRDTARRLEKYRRRLSDAIR